MHDRTILGLRLIRILEIATVLVATATAVMLFAFFTHSKGGWEPPLFYSTAIANAVLFLIYFRHLLRNDRVPKAKKDLWSIILFATGAFGDLIYLQRFVKQREGKEQASQRI